MGVSDFFGWYVTGDNWAILVPGFMILFGLTANLCFMISARRKSKLTVNSELAEAMNRAKDIIAAKMIAQVPTRDLRAEWLHDCEFMDLDAFAEKWRGREIPKRPEDFDFSQVSVVPDSTAGLSTAGATTFSVGWTAVASAPPALKTHSVRQQANRHVAAYGVANRVAWDRCEKHGYAMIPGSHPCPLCPLCPLEPVTSTNSNASSYLLNFAGLSPAERKYINPQTCPEYFAGCERIPIGWKNPYSAPWTCWTCRDMRRVLSCFIGDLKSMRPMQERDPIEALHPCPNCAEGRLA